MTSRSGRARVLSLLGSIAVIVLAALLAACSSSSVTPAPTADGPITAPPATPAPSAPAPTPAPSAPTPTPAPAFPVTLTDDEGTSVTLAAAPQRIISLTPAVTETLFALGVGDRIVGNTDFDDYPAAVKDIPHVASYTGVDVEKVVGSKPDLVIAGGNGFNPPDEIAKIRALGIPVLVVYADSFDGILHDIDLVGDAVGRSDAALALMEWMNDQVIAISRAAREAAPERPRVFYELDATKDIYGPAPKSFLASMIELAGGDPITTGDPAVFSIPQEDLVAADPQVIVLGDAAYGTTADAVAARPGWAGMTAVKAGAIRPVDDTVVTRPGPRIVEGLRALTLAIHPDVDLPEVGSPPPLPAP